MSNLSNATELVKNLTSAGTNRRDELIKAIVDSGIKKATAHSYLHTIEKKLGLTLIAAPRGKRPADPTAVALVVAEKVEAEPTADRTTVKVKKEKAPKATKSRKISRVAEPDDTVLHTLDTSDWSELTDDEVPEFLRESWKKAATE